MTALLFCAVSCGKEQAPAAGDEPTATVGEVPVFTAEPETEAVTETEESPAPAVEPPPALTVGGVPLIRQLPAWPTGCEAVSAVMLLQYLGYGVTPAVFIRDHLPTGGAFYVRGDTFFGPDPDETFIGYPWDEGGWGCFPGAIRRGMLSLGVPEADVRILSGMTLSEIAVLHLTEGRPVLVWVCYNMGNASDGGSWTLPDGSPFTWPAGVPTRARGALIENSAISVVMTVAMLLTIPERVPDMTLLTPL
ncbi:MAG: C39 family peptidase, partial [Clostridia bacterium]|nr:C39 family peptidase [Clostridia bacterium]